jgi:hypothetical protein
VHLLVVAYPLNGGSLPIFGNIHSAPHLYPEHPQAAEARRRKRGHRMAGIALIIVMGVVVTLPLSVAIAMLIGKVLAFCGRLDDMDPKGPLDRPEAVLPSHVHEKQPGSVRQERACLHSRKSDV